MSDSTVSSTDFGLRGTSLYGAVYPVVYGFVSGSLLLVNLGNLSNSAGYSAHSTRNESRASTLVLMCDSCPDH
jgi:hypothetical protein